MPNHKTDINNRGGFSSDMIGMNHNYPEASYNERNDIIRQHEIYTKGLLYFYGHDPRVPAELRNEMLQYGYPKDEYRDNNNWSPQPDIRECRRMIGAHVMTQANCQGRERVEDGIGMAAYTMDSHNCERIVVNGMVKNEGNVEIGGFGPYPISYRSLIPRETECKNLYVPVCLSASHIAYGSIRMEPVFMTLAQSASVAACLAIDAKQTVQRVDVKKLRDLLQKDPLLDKSMPEIGVDNDDSAHIVFTGDWKRMKVGGYGPSYLLAEKGGTEKKLRFVPIIETAGAYALYAYIPNTANAASRIDYLVFDGKNGSHAFVNKADIQVEGQTSGEWILLGKYFFQKGSFVELTNKDADGTIVADAMLFVPVKEVSDKKSSHIK
jgi:hypothetical protein